MAMSDFGEQILVTNANGITFDLNKDYTKAINAASSAAEKAQLEKERQAKIDSKAYGGAYKTSVNDSASLGTKYNASNTVFNRTSTKDSFRSEQADELQAQLAAQKAQMADLTKYLEDMYAANQEAELAALKSAYDKNVAEMESQNDQIVEMYRSAKNQQAAQNALETQRMNEIGIAQGLNTGASGQMALAQSAALQAALGNLTTQEMQSLANNRLAMSQLGADYNNAVVQTSAQINAERNRAMYEELVRQAELAEVQRQKDAALAQDTQNAARNEALALLSTGVMPSASMLAAAGMTTEDANLWLASYRNQQKQTGTVATEPTYKPTLKWEQVEEAIKNGNITAGVLADYEYYMQEPYKQPGKVDMSNWGNTAKNLYNQYMADPNPNLYAQRLYDLNYLAKETGQITNEELNALLDLLGVPG